ncbi:MAG: PilZ domain-containing protein [Bdellovibrionales bacterium]|nr:PilZ domain-containing protein [Bdellovibrionales bacterium]
MQTKGQIWIFFDSATKKKTKPMTLIEAQMIVLRLKVKQARKLFIWTPGWEKWQPLEAYLKLNQSFFAVAPSRISRAVPRDEKKPSSTETEDIVISDNQSMVTSLNEEKSEASKSVNEDHISAETVTAAVSSGGTYTATATEFVSNNTTTETGTGSTEEKSKGAKSAGSTTKKKKPIDYEVFDFHGDHLEMKPKTPPMKPSSLNEKRGFGRYEFAFEVILVSKGGKSFRTTSQNISMGGTLLETPIPREFLGTVFDLIIVNKLEQDPKKSRFLFRGKIAGDYNDPRRLTFVDPAKETTENLAALLLSLEAYDENLKKSPAKPKAG